VNPLDAGYSGTPLDQKLGFKSEDTIYVEDTPDWYSDWAAAHDLELEPGLPATHAHLFFNNKAGLAEFLKQNNLNDIEKSFWVSWPKQVSKVKTDLTEQAFRDLILPLGWVDTKVAAIDDTWSGLKFLRRKS
jgi:hypothetical protein